MIIVENTAQVPYHPFSATQALSWRVCSHPASELSDPPGGKTSADLRRRAQQQELVNVVMIAMTLAIPPEKLPSWRAAVVEMATGSRRVEFAAARRRQGVRRQGVWLQQGPDGPREILVLETDDPARAFELMATSHDPFDVWLRAMLMDTYKLDLAQPAGPPPEQILDWSDDQPEEDA